MKKKKKQILTAVLAVIMALLLLPTQMRAGMGPSPMTERTATIGDATFSDAEKENLVSRQETEGMEQQEELQQEKMPVMLAKKAASDFVSPWNLSAGRGSTGANSEGWWQGVHGAILASGITPGVRTGSGHKDPFAIDCSTYFSALANGTHGGTYPGFPSGQSGYTGWIYSSYLNPALGKCQLIATGYAGYQNQPPVGADNFLNGNLRNGDVLLFTDQNGVSKHIAIACSGGLVYDDGSGYNKWNSFYNYMGWLRSGSFASARSAAPYWQAYRPVVKPNHEPYRAGLAIRKTDMNGKLILDPATFHIQGPDGFAKDVTTGTPGTDGIAEKGMIWVGGLKPGTYQIQETKAPAGCQKTDQVFRVTLADPQENVVYRDGVDYTGVFCAADYRKYYASEMGNMSDSDLLNHYLTYVVAGKEERRGASFFNIRAYRANYGNELAQHGIRSNQAVIRHYIQSGYKEGRRPLFWDEIFSNGAGSSIQGVTVQNRTLTEWKGGIAVRKTDLSGNRIRKAGTEFDVYKEDRKTKCGHLVTDEEGYAYMGGLAGGTYYVKETKPPAGYLLNPDFSEGITIETPQSGVYIDGNLDYAGVFGEADYQKLNPDLGQKNGTFVHFLTTTVKGKEKRRGSFDFDITAYRANNPDLAKLSQKDLFRHYLTNGNREGRRTLTWEEIFSSPKGSAFRGTTVQDTEKRYAVALQKRAADGYQEMMEENPEKYSLEGAEYGVYTSREDADNDRNEVGTLVTDENGEAEPLEISWEQFGTGTERTFYVKEKTAPAGFRKDSEIYPVTVREENTPQNPAVAEVMDVPEMVKGSIRLVKYFDGKGEDGSEDTPGSGVKFQITRRNKAGDPSEEVREITTDEKGEAKAELEFGDYLLEEIACEGNQGYQLEKPIFFSIRKEGEEILLTDPAAKNPDGKIWNEKDSSISTRAYTEQDNEKMILPEPRQVIRDEVFCRNLASGQRYRLTETLKLVTDAGEISDFQAVDENPVQTEFQTETDYERSRFEGKDTQLVTFTGVDGSQIPENARLVIFSTLEIVEDTDMQKPQWKIFHEDAGNEAQTIYVDRPEGPVTEGTMTEVTTEAAKTENGTTEIPGTEQAEQDTSSEDGNPSTGDRKTVWIAGLLILSGAGIGILAGVKRRRRR